MPCVMNTIVVPVRRQMAEQLVLQRLAGLRVERGERLVHQQHVRLVGEAAGDRDALLHAAGQLVRVAVGEAGEADELEHLAGAARARLRRPTALDLEAELDVGLRGAPGEQRVLLEDDAAVEARAGDRLAVEQDLARWPARSSPAIRSSSVDLPQPLGPTSTRNSPARTSKVTPSMAARRVGAVRSGNVLVDVLDADLRRAQDELPLRVGVELVGVEVVRVERCRSARRCPSASSPSG